MILDEGINVLIKIPLHYLAWKHRVYRATEVSQPIDNGHTATRFQLERKLLIFSNRQNELAEVTADWVSSHCTGSERLKLWTKPFAKSRSATSLCLSSLYFDLGTEILKLCPQIVMPLPENPVAEYLYNCTYLVTARSDDYFLFNYTHNQKETGEPIPGCRSCLVRPSCGGRIENPTGSMILTPDSNSCQYETGHVINVKQHRNMEALL